MKKIFISIILVFLLALNIYAREKVTPNELATYKTLLKAGIVEGEYSQKQLNDAISKIDAMSMTISSYSKLSDKAKFCEDQLLVLYEAMYESDNFVKELIQIDLDEQTKLIKEIEQKKNSPDYLLWGLVILGLFL